jgi:aspartate dehydrogenase
MKENTISVIGCGSLAHVLARGLPKLSGVWKIKSVLGRDPGHAASFAQEFGCAAYTDFDAFLADASDLVIEVAGGAALKSYAAPLLNSGRSLVAVSSGALLAEGLFEELRHLAAMRGARLYIPNGAVGGLDVLTASRYQKTGGRLSIQTTKSPASLRGAAGFTLTDEQVSEKREIFRGSVKEAVRLFPKNINVAATTSLAAANPDIEVSIVSDPAAKTNVHRIRFESGELNTDMTFASVPDPANPRTSQTTAYSILALLESFTAPVVFF